jgi:hypothetical protein
MKTGLEISNEIYNIRTQICTRKSGKTKGLVHYKPLEELESLLEELKEQKYEEVLE